MNALVGGQVDYMCDQIVNAVPQVKGGTIKAYAIATPERNPSLPNVPTTKEAGLPAFQASGLERAVRAQGHAGADRRQAERRGSPRRSTTRACASACSISAA
jgi:tripartite-type tricarboxylate transporter receptor subunit TctC